MVDNIFYNSKDVYLAKQCKGIVHSNCYGYKVINYKEKGLTEYTSIDILRGSTFKVINFNVGTKRVVVFLNKSEKDTNIIELDYNVLLNSCTIDSPNLFKPVDSLLVVYTEKAILTTDTLYKILSYVGVAIVMLIVGHLF